MCNSLTHPISLEDFAWVCGTVKQYIRSYNCETYHSSSKTLRFYNNAGRMLYLLPSLYITQNQRGPFALNTENYSMQCCT